MSRSRLFLRFALLMSISLLSFAGMAQAQDATPDNSSNGTIGVRDILESGKASSDEFTSNATAYLYGFLGSKGDTVTISMVQKQDSTLDPFLVLLGPRGEMLASDDDSGTDVFGSALISSKKLPDDGVYLVIASTFAHINELLVETGQETEEPTDQTFDLTVTGNTTPADTSSALIYTKDMVKGDSLDGESTLASPVGYYTYEGKAGETISITAKSITADDGSEIDSILHVFDPDGNRIAVNDTDPQDTTSAYNAGIHDLTLPKDGTYLIFATDVFFFNAGNKDAAVAFTGGKYTISIN